MPYIEKERVAEIRAALKKEMPDLKLSVVRRDYMEVAICVVAAYHPGWAKYAGKYEQVNHYYIADHYEGKVKRDLLKIAEIARKDQRIVSRDTDYGDWPNYYVHINIGKWDRPLEYKPKKAA